VLTSDHGNMEDLSTGSHTRNPVPLLARGPQARRFAAAESIADVTPAILSALAA
jgi:bisphosphoglycerate-independent phosphoglycerate mutase (AlkP superfamily)